MNFKKFNDFKKFKCLKVKNIKSSETVIEAKQEANMGFRDGEGEPMGLSGMREQMMLLFLFNIKTSDIHYI